MRACIPLLILLVGCATPIVTVENKRIGAAHPHSTPCIDLVITYSVLGRKKQWYTKDSVRTKTWSGRFSPTDLGPINLLQAPNFGKVDHFEVLDCAGKVLYESDQNIPNNAYRGTLHDLHGYELAITLNNHSTGVADLSITWVTQPLYKPKPSTLPPRSNQRTNYARQ